MNFNPISTTTRWAGLPLHNEVRDILEDIVAEDKRAGEVIFFTKPVYDCDLIEKDRIARQTRAKMIELQKRLATLTPRDREVLSYVVSCKRN